MATLSGNTIASTYLGLLNVSGAVGATTLESVTDGAGTATSLSLSQQKAKILLGTDSGDDFTINDGSNDILLIEGDTKDVTVLDDFILISDSSVIKMGAGADATFTHDGTTGLTIAATPISINSTGNLVLDSTIDIILDAAGGTFEFRDAGTTQLTIDVDGTAGDIDINLNVDGDDLVFNQYNGTEVMRMADSAYVGINEGAPSYRLDVTENRASNWCTRIGNYGANANRWGLLIKCGDNDHANSSIYATFQEPDGGAVGEIRTSTGNLEFNDASDVSLKKNIRDTALNGLNIVNGIKVRDFEWKSDNVTKTAGVIAQEVKEVLPNAVDTMAGTELFGVTKMSFLMPMLKAIQELSAKVTALENA